MILSFLFRLLSAVVAVIIGVGEVAVMGGSWETGGRESFRMSEMEGSERFVDPEVAVKAEGAKSRDTLRTTDS